MKSIRFETGYKTFSINDDPDRTISFNPTDADIVQRFTKAIKELQSEKETMADIQLNPDGTAAINDMSSLEEASATLERFNDLIKQKLNYIFNSDVYDVVFAGQSPFSIVGKDHKLLFEAFLEAAFEVVNEEGGAAAQSRMGKYTDKYKK